MAGVNTIKAVNFVLALDRPAPDGSVTSNCTVDFTNSRTSPTLSLTYGSSNSVNFGGTVTGGTFTLGVQVGSGAVQSTTAIPWNATPAAVQAALVALSGVGAGNVTVTGGPGPASYVVTFTGTEASSQSNPGVGAGAVVLTVNGAALTGTAPTAAVVNTTTTVTPSISAREIDWENLALAVDVYTGQLIQLLRAAAGQPLSFADLSEQTA